MRLLSFLNCVKCWTNFTFLHQQVSLFFITLFVFPRTATIRSHKSLAFQDNLRAHFWQFSYGFQVFFFEMMVINAWSRYFVELLSRPVCQLTILFHAFLEMPFHIVGPRRNTKIFRAWKFFSSTRRNSWFKHGSVTVNNILAYFTLSLSATQVYMIKERCGFSQINFFIEYFPYVNVLFPTNFVSSAHTDKNNLFLHCVRFNTPK